MGCDIHWYSETLKEGHWTCDQADSHELDQNYSEYYPDTKPRYKLDTLPGCERNYWFFGLLSNGVRTSWPFSFNSKSQPDDLSEMVAEQLEYWEDDSHSHNWLTREELIAKKAELEILRPQVLIDDSLEFDMLHLDVLIECLTKTIERMEAASPGTAPEDQRVVLWFDN